MTSTEPYLQPPAYIGPPRPEHAGSKRRFQGIPGIERAPNGRIWATWYGGTGASEDRYNHVLVASSADGRTWDAPSLVVDPDGDGPVRAFDPCLWHDPNGTLWLFWAQGYEKRQDDPRAGVWAIRASASQSAEPNWSAPRRLCDGIMMNKPTVVSSGHWMIPTADWKAAPSACVAVSSDRGERWDVIGGATIPDPAHRNCDEHTVVERQDGSLWMWVRTSYGIGFSESSDGGATWRDVVPSPIAHTKSRFFVRRLASGRLLLVKHGDIREDCGRSHLKAFLSEDDGVTWSAGLLLDERESISYPDAAEDEGGRIHLIYDFDRRRAMEILYTTFSEADVLEGRERIDPPPVIVNKATGR